MLTRFLGTRVYGPFRLSKDRIRIGKKSVFPLKKGCLIAAHHEEWADGIVIAACIPELLHWVVALGGTTRTFKGRIVRKLSELSGFISIQGRTTMQLNEEIEKHIRNGDRIVFFPEGTLRKERKEKFGTPKKGIVKIAAYLKERLGMDVPIYPLGLDYTDGPWKHVSVNIGQEILLGNEPEEKSMERIMQEIRRLSGA